jgi:hypothetical protein
VCGQLPAPAAFPPERIGYDAEWAPSRPWTSWRRDKHLDPARVRISDHPVRSLVTIPTELSQLPLFKLCETWFKMPECFDKRLVVQLLGCNTPPPPPPPQAAQSLENLLNSQFHHFDSCQFSFSSSGVCTGSFRKSGTPSTVWVTDNVVTCITKPDKP